MHSSMPMCEKGMSRVGIIVVEQRSVGTYLAICRKNRGLEQRSVFMYLVIHGEVHVLIVRSGWATMRTSGRKSC